MICKYFRTIKLYQDNTNEQDDVDQDLVDNGDVSQSEIDELSSGRLKPYSGTTAATIVPNRKKTKRNGFYEDLNPSSNVLNNSQVVSILTDNATNSLTTMESSHYEYTNPYILPPEPQQENEFQNDLNMIGQQEQTINNERQQEQTVNNVPKKGKRANGGKTKK